MLTPSRVNEGKLPKHPSSILAGSRITSSNSMPDNLRLFPCDSQAQSKRTNAS